MKQSTTDLIMWMIIGFAVISLIVFVGMRTGNFHFGKQYIPTEIIKVQDNPYLDQMEKQIYVKINLDGREIIKGDTSFFKYYNSDKEFGGCLNITLVPCNKTLNINCKDTLVLSDFVFNGYGSNETVEGNTVFYSFSCKYGNAELHSHPHNEQSKNIAQVLGQKDECFFSMQDVYFNPYSSSLEEKKAKYQTQYLVLVCSKNMIKITTRFGYGQSFGYRYDLGFFSFLNIFPNYIDYSQR